MQSRSKHSRRRDAGGARGSGQDWRRWALFAVGASIVSLGLLNWPAMAPVPPLEDEPAGLDTPEYNAAFRPGGVDLAQMRRAPMAHWLAADGCVLAGQANQDTPERAALTQLMRTLAYSPTGEALLRQAAAYRVRICADRDTHLLAYYFANINVAAVKWQLSEGARVIFLAHELAHIPQHPQFSDNRYFPPGDLILLRRMREATAEAVATRIAWELRQEGYTQAWDEKLATPYADVAQAFERVATMRPDRYGTLLSATRAAFDQWFAEPWRRNVYDRMTVAHLRRISKDALGLVPPRRALSHAYLLPMGRLDDGNYLADQAARRLTDGFYAGGMSRQVANQIKHFRRHSTRPGRWVADSGFSDVAS